VDEGIDGIELARRVGVAHTLGVFLAGNIAESLLRLGDYERAAALLDEALATGINSASVASPILMRAELATARGELELARELATRARAVLGDDAQHQYEAHLGWIVAELARLDGEFDKARATIELCLRGEDTMLGRYSWPLVWLGLRIEREAESVPSERLVQLVDELEVQSAPAARYRSLAVAELRQDEQSWQAAVDAVRDGDEPLLLAYTLLRLAELRSDEETLSESLGLARELGAAPLVTAGEALARRERLAVPVGDAARPAADDRFGLTDRELDVLRLVAAGQSNAEIGKELFISPKTASVHVSNILGKLGVTRRGEAAATAHELGLL
jgi:ATP/maltotriose-dependent transcriptional regulator MalT